ncbi:MAG TPA: type II secretion system F family protein [Methanosphaera sp.]|nr:type II secretion system F family protein [Methanosphaera sp.]
MTFKRVLSKNYQNKDKEKIEDEIIDEILELKKNRKKSINRQVLTLPLICIFFLILTRNLGMTLKIVMIIFLIALFKDSLPKMKEKRRKKEISREFPFALMQISTQLKAGIGLYDSIKSITNSNYGELSREFQITLNEIQYESNYVKAFENLSKRCKLESIDKFSSQVIRTLNNGGNLADTLKALARENSHNSRIKYREYSEKLNAIMLLYMFIGIIIPVLLFILIIAVTTLMDSVIKSEMLIILYLFFFPMILVFIIIIIRELEPDIG